MEPAAERSAAGCAERTSASPARNGRRLNHPIRGWATRRSEMRGKRLLAVGALAGVLALAGCGGDDDDGSAAKPAAGELSGTVTTWIMDPGSPKLQEVLNGQGTAFEADNPGTDVKIEFVPWAQAH